MTLAYEIKVEGLKIDGHPHQLLVTDLYAASHIFDQLVKQYPTKDVSLIENRKIQINFHRGVPKIPIQCPKGHTGLRDRKSILTQGMNETWNCGVCGKQWREE